MSVGINETKEAALALIAIGAKVLQARKVAMADGKIDFSDGQAVYAAIAQDAEFQAVVKAGADKIEQVPGELADISFKEGIELMGTVGPAIIKALKEAKA
jgi:hypothetical protein